MSERRPYLRAQSRYWWVKPPYRAYTLRELCGVVLAAYAAILLIGLICLASGPEAYETYRRSLASPWSLLIHLVLLAAALWHVWTWFQILPKTMPKLIWQGMPVRQTTMTKVAILLAVVCSVMLLASAAIVGAWI
ncbi:MAG: fumarate reductase subunit C [Bradyrhizobium sp.]